MFLLIFGSGTAQVSQLESKEGPDTWMIHKEHKKEIKTAYVCTSYPNVPFEVFGDWREKGETGMY